MLGSPPYPDIETLKSLFSPMIPRLCLLQNTLEQTPKVGGRTLYKQYYQGVCSIVESVEEFCKQVSDTNCRRFLKVMQFKDSFSGKAIEF